MIDSKVCFILSIEVSLLNAMKEKEEKRKKEKVGRKRRRGWGRRRNEWERSSVMEGDEGGVVRIWERVREVE